MGTQMGGPGGGRMVQKPIPPERGSFPLDHDAECKSFMTDYLNCIKKNRGQNSTDCRVLSKEYLQCRMEHNLMAPDEFKNLGYGKEFDDEVKNRAAPSRGSGSMPSIAKGGTGPSTSGEPKW